MEKSLSCSTADTKRCARDILKHIIREKNKKEATIVGLSGELGSGKTTFAQYVGEGLGVLERINSPTFVIIKKYELVGGNAFDRLFHIDAYRLESGDELLALGWKEISSDPQSLIVVEWAEKVEEVLPKDTIWIQFEHVREGERKIEIKSKIKS